MDLEVERGASPDAVDRSPPTLTAGFRVTGAAAPPGSVLAVFDAGRRELVGTATGSVKVDGVATAVNEALTLDLPESMDGTWTVLFLLEPAAKGVGCAARLTLANGAAYVFTAKGKAQGTAVVLNLTGHAADPADRGIRIRTTVTPLEGGWARLEAFAGKGHGQTLAW